MKENTIVLLYEETLFSGVYKKNVKMEVGNLITVPDSEAEELRRWNITEKDSAFSELKKHKCVIKAVPGGIYVEEYALEFFEEDDEGRIVEGSNFEFAELEINLGEEPEEVE